MENSGKNDAYARYLVKYSDLKSLSDVDLHKRIRQIIKTNNELIDLLRQKDLELTKVSKSNPKNQSPEYKNSFNPKWKGVEKVIYILKHKKKVMFTGEIEEELYFLDKPKQDKLKNSYQALAKIIYNGVYFKRLVRYEVILSKGYTYGLPEWFDEDNNLLKKYSR